MEKLSEEMKNNRYGLSINCIYCGKDFIFKENQLIVNFTDIENKVMCPYCYNLMKIKNTETKFNLSF